MCGLFASVGCDVGESALEEVLKVLEHRGPDGRGLFRDRSTQLAFAHTRLAVIDLETGDQPIESADGEIVLIANGEIYDFERIRGSLEARGRRFRTNGDTEVILHLYREFGLDCFEQLRGEFAFLLYDKPKQLLIAARDRFGIKPLYFSRLPGGFVFASEMKAIFASGLVAPALNVEAFDPLLNDDPQNVRFPFEGIEHVPPASYMIVDLETQESRIAQYWSAEIPAATAQAVAEPFGDAPAAAARTVLRELDEAVTLRLRADVPVGLYLSGGVDSSFVGALMKRKCRSPFHSFSVSFAGDDRDEGEFARRAAEVLGTVHHELAVTREMLWDNLEDCLWFTELPFVSLAPVGTFLLSEEARKHVTVTLNGQGADEVFLGYRKFFRNAIRRTREGRVSSPRLARLKLGAFPLPLVQRLSLLAFHKGRRRQLASARSINRPPPKGSKPLINFVQETRIAEMPIDILGFLGDRVEMAHSLEVRVPFLDHHLYDAAKSIPVDFKMRGDTEKAVLRDAAIGILPDDLRERRKLGFMHTSDPLDFFGSDRRATEKLRTYLSKQAFEAAQIFSYPAYRLIALLARIPVRRGVPVLWPIRRYSNRLIMYMMQTHMLHRMFVADPRWLRPVSPRLNDPAKPAQAAGSGRRSRGRGGLGAGSRSRGSTSSSGFR